MILSWLVSLAAHVNFRRRHSLEEISRLPLRSPLGKWGSVIGFFGVTVALIQTWLYPLVNLWSGLTCIGVLIVAYAAAKSQRKTA